MTERKFTRGLNKPGMAAQLRENISQVVRESASLNPVLYHPSGPENYTTLGNVCPQEDDIYNFSEVIGDDDCLFMNIYAPKTSGSDQYPVLVFVHGGTFMVGSAQQDVANGVDLLIDSSKPILVDPIDFEGFITKNKTLIQNDPQRELLLYPNDDVAEVVLPKKFRTVISNIPSFAKALASSAQNGSSSGSGKSAAATNGTSSQCASPSHDTNGSHRPAVNPTGHLLTRQALHTYESANHLIHYKYSAYGGTYQELPRKAMAINGIVFPLEISMVDQNCIVCYEKLQWPIFCPRCKQGNCFDCLVRWFGQKQECPKCRYGFQLRTDGRGQYGCPRDGNLIEFYCEQCLECLCRGCTGSVSPHYRHPVKSLDHLRKEMIDVVRVLEEKRNLQRVEVACSFGYGGDTAEKALNKIKSLIPVGSPLEWVQQRRAIQTEIDQLKLVIVGNGPPTTSSYYLPNTDFFESSFFLAETYKEQCLFSAADQQGNTWELAVYPGGFSDAKGKFISLYLKLVRGTPMRYEYRFKLFDKFNQPLETYYAVDDFTVGSQSIACQRLCEINQARQKAWGAKGYQIAFATRPTDPMYGLRCATALAENKLKRISASDELKEELYEIDTDHDRLDEQMTRSQADTITKQGYLLKGPDTNSDRMFAHIGSKSFKRRYCYLRQEIDGTYILELHKDEKQVEAKTTIVMDFCTEVVPNPKKGRYCFELKMNAPQQKSFTLAADDEADMDDWLKKISSVIQQNKLQEDKRVASLERTSAPTPPPASPSTMMMYGTLKGLDQSMNPQLMKYGRETDMSIAQARKDNRRRLFGAYQQHGGSAKAAVSSKAEPVEPYREQFGQRILLKCDSLKFRLQAPVEGTCPSPASNGEGEVALCQLEPYLSSVALYDAKNGRKLTENFYFDLNKDHVRDMLNASWEAEKPQCTSPKPTSKSHQNGNGTLRHSKTRCDTSDDLHPDVTKEWIARAKHAIFSVTSPNPDIFVVVKIDKILQGAINPSTEPYLKASKDVKLLCKLQKTVRQYAHKCGHYRMPFAWAARPLFRLYSNDLDTSFDFPAIYRQEGAKLKDDELLKLLAEYRKPDKFSKLTVIPGSLKIYIEALNEFPPNCLTTTLVPLKPFPSPPSVDPTLEVTEFENRGSDQHLNPYATFVNHLYVYPLQLNYDSQKIFSRARNLAVLVELRDSDTTEARSIECIYGRPGQPMLVSQMSCSVLHHNTSPTWYEEIKLRLPLRITAQHHLLFSFFHVSCNIAKKKDLVSTVAETPVGYAWLPLLNKGKLNIEEQCLPVAASLPAGYLSIQPLGLGKGNSGPEIQWIDNQRQIFTISFRLDSTVLTTDQHLHNLFLHADRLLDQPKTAALPAESESCKILKAAHAIQINSLITFLPTILNQLFTLLVATQSDEIGLNVIRLLVNTFHMISEEAKRKELLLSYVRYVFRIEAFPVNGCSPTSQQVSTVHGELCRHLPTLLHQNNTDFLLVNKFMKYSGIFFDIIIKSMGQFLLTTGRIKMQRSERFPKEFSTRIESLFSVLLPYLNSRHKDLPMETDTLNQSMSVFVKRCLTFMDRGFVFRLIRLYMDRWCPGDSRVLQEYKFAFIREICSHEHYIPLNLPFLLSPNNRPPDLLQQFCLSEDFCRQHFLAGMLLQEVKSSLNEISHIRRLGLTILKDLLAKHDLDDRYQNKGQLSRIALLYVPWLGIVLENLSRIPDGLDKKKHDSIGTNRMSCSSSYVFARESTPATVPQSVTSQTSTPKSRSNRVTMHFDCPSPIRSSLHLKDTSFLAAIAGQMSLSNGHSTTSLNSECSTLSQDGTVVIRNNSSEINGSSRPSHARSISVTQPTIIQRTDKFTPTETKDLLISFLFVVKHLSPDHMLAWWHNCTESETVQFFTVLDLSLLYFRYVGKKNIQVQHEAGKDTRATKSAKASTLPARMMPPSSESAGSFDSGTLNHPQTRENLVEETMRLHRALYESNLATEIGLIILDCMGLYSIQFRDSMLESSVLPKIARVYLRFLQLGQSESLSKHVFAALRAFINNFSQALFKGNAILCGQLVYELLKCCDSRLSSLRQEACAVLYLLMRSNFEFSGRKGLTRVHLQVIISVSQMIGNVIGLNNARFQESLSIINSYATSDKAMKGTGFPMEVKDLTRRVRTVLMATAQMQAHHMDPERLLELQHSLANSYASTPELRHTWLVTMARNHEQNGNISEAACCYLHIAALISEYLKLKGCCSVAFGAESFVKISRNIPRDEKGLKLDSGASDSQYTEQLLLDQLKECAECLDRAERHECLGELYRLIVPILEGRRDYPGLAQCYEHLMQSYNRVIEFNKSGKRLLGRFYRVIYYGQAYFEEENAVEYVYKEPKVTSLSEISERLHKQYRDKFGSDNVKMIMDSSPVDVSSLDPKMAYIQVTHVTPFFCKDELEIRQTEFEQNHDVDTFMYETPFTPNGGARGSVEDQWKRRTILTTQYSFPYVLKRVPVKERQTLELSPIEVAIDEMQAKVAELEEVVLGPIDLKKLQLRLQGSVAVTVNAGPLAYASAFLDPKQCFKYASDKVEDLKDIFREFIRICFTALQINANVISSDQREYHSALKENYENLCSALSDLLGEFIYPLDDSNNNAHRHSLALFSAISGAPNNSSTA